MAERRSSNSSHSQISESLQTVEESLLVSEKSSPVVLGRQESVFLAESSASTSVEDQENSGNSKAFNQRFVFESCETIQSESVAESEILTEEGDYSDEFESSGSRGGILHKGRKKRHSCVTHQVCLVTTADWILAYVAVCQLRICYIFKLLTMKGIPANSPGFPGSLHVFHQISRSPG